MDEEKKEVLEKTDSEELTTGVDQLLELLKKQEKIPLSEAAEELEVGLDVVQSWVDFLVEEQIVGIEYKFTKPYIYLNKPDEEVKEEEEEKSFEGLKKNFLQKAKNKNIPDQNVRSLWTNHVEQALESKKEYFIQECERRGLDNSRELWEKYKKKLLRVS